MRTLSDLQVLIDRIPFAEGNLGEEAILASLLQDLEACGVKHISVLSNMPERTRHRHGAKIRIIPDSPLRWFQLPAEVSKADLLIWGGGHMLQDRSSRLYVPYVAKTLLLAKLQGIPRFIYAPGMGPVVTRLGKATSRWAIKGSRAVTVRDDVSLEFLKSIDLSHDVLRTADPAFSLRIPESDPRAKKNADSPAVGFAPRRLFYRSGSWFPVRWQLAARQANPRLDGFLQEAAAALDYLIEQRNAKVRLFPMDLGPNPRDDLICHRLRNYMIHSHAAEVLDDDPPLDEFLRRLSELDLLISARLHGVILGLRFGLPFLGIDSDGKIEGLARSINYGEFVLRADHVSRDPLCRLATQALDDGIRLRRDLWQRAAILKYSAQQNCEALRRCLEAVAAEG